MVVGSSDQRGILSEEFMARAMRLVLSGAFALALVVALSSGAFTQMMRNKYPELFFEATPIKVVDKMFEVAKVTKDDYVFDLGSGDGRIPILAAMRHGARGFGVDIDPKLIEIARANAEKAGVADRVEFRQQDLFETSVKEATVVALYLFVWANVKLRPRLISELRPGSRIVAHDFPVGDDWRPDVQVAFGDRTIYLWYVPAQVAGEWAVKGAAQPFSIRLSQRFQQVKGAATLEGRRPVPVRSVRLRGDEIDFVVELEPKKRTEFRGRVVGDRIEPRTEPGAEALPWSAMRTAPAAEPASKKRG